MDQDQPVEQVEEPFLPPIAATYSADITLRGTEAAPPTIAVLERAVEEALSGFGFRVRVSARRTDK